MLQKYKIKALREGFSFTFKIFIDHARFSERKTAPIFRFAKNKDLPVWGVGLLSELSNKG